MKNNFWNTLYLKSIHFNDVAHIKGEVFLKFLSLKLSTILFDVKSNDLTIVDE